MGSTNTKSKINTRPGDRVTIRPGVLETNTWDQEGDRYARHDQPVAAVVDQLGGMPVCEWDCWVEFTDPLDRDALGRSGSWVNFEDIEAAS